MEFTIRYFLSLFVLLLYSNASAFAYYYGRSFNNNSITLKEDLYIILSSIHNEIPQDFDEITSSCQRSSCYQFSPLTSYKEARKHLFGYLHLEYDSHESTAAPYLITSYCQQKIVNADLSASSPLAPFDIPDTKVINTEHVWPQSRFSSLFSETSQKNNLHILLPVLSRVNSVRSNHPMGNVVSVSSQPCSGASLGKDNSGKTVFEPHSIIKGDVARSLFYFSIRFKMSIEDSEERVLRQWHQQDPPDFLESSRHENIFRIQKDRNPFIDMPELVTRITNF